MNRTYHLLAATLVWTVLAAGCYGTGSSGPAAPDAAKGGGAAEQALVDKAQAVIEFMKKSPEFDVINDYLPRATGVLVFPKVVKAGFILGGQGGSGVLLGRDEAGNWSAPAFYTLGGGSIGLQAGGQRFSLVLVFLNEPSLKKALDSGLTLGVDASVAAGDSGAKAEASVARIASDLVYLVDVSGVFAGASLEGGVVKARNSRNTSYYGRAVSPFEIVVGHKVDAPGAAGLRRALSVSR